MSRTDPDALEALRVGGVLPTYWRRKRETARWHRGFRLGPKVVHSQCDKIAGLHKGNLLFAPIEEPWPDPHCRACEWATPGTDAAREGLDVNVGVSSSQPARGSNS